MELQLYSPASPGVLVAPMHTRKRHYKEHACNTPFVWPSRVCDSTILLFAGLSLWNYTAINRANVARQLALPLKSIHDQCHVLCCSWEADALLPGLSRNNRSRLATVGHNTWHDIMLWGQPNRLWGVLIVEQWDTMYMVMISLCFLE
jgi:hypothetical protein